MKSEKQITDAIDRLQARYREEPDLNKCIKIWAQIDALFWVQYTDFGECFLQTWQAEEEEE